MGLYGVRGWVVSFVGMFRGEHQISAHAHVARADRTGHGALVTQSATDFVWLQNSSGRLRSRSMRAPRAVGWTRLALTAARDVDVGMNAHFT